MVRAGLSVLVFALCLIGVQGCAEALETEQCRNNKALKIAMWVLIVGAAAVPFWILRGHR